MDLRVAAGLAGYDRTVRDRLESLRAEARDERQACAARAARPASTRRASPLSIVVRTLRAATTGGTD